MFNTCYQVVCDRSIFSRPYGKLRFAASVLILVKFVISASVPSSAYWRPAPGEWRTTNRALQTIQNVKRNLYATRLMLNYFADVVGPPLSPSPVPASL